MVDRELRELLAAEASGDLDPVASDRLRVRLTGDADARRLLRQLNRDAARLRSLPKVMPPTDLTPRVMTQLEQRPIIRLSERYRQKPRAKWHRWAAWVTTVAVIVGAVYVIRMPRNVGARPDDAAPEFVHVAPPVEPENPALAAQVPDPECVPEPRGGDTVAPKVLAKSPSPKKAPSEVYTSPPEVRAPLVEVTAPRLYLALTAADLRNNVKRLTDELGRASDHKVDLFAKDTAKTMEELARALKARGLVLIADPVVVEAQRRKLRIGYTIYHEGITAGSFVNALKPLFAVDGPLETLVVTPVDDFDRREARNLLGVDPFDPAMQKRPTSEAGSKPSDKNKDAGRTSPAAFMGFFPLPKASAGRDPQGFLDRRPDMGPGKLRLFVIVRGIGT